MALLNKRYDSVHSKTGNGKKKLKANFDEGHINTLTDLAESGINPEFGALLYQIQLMQDDIDELRRYITAEVGDGATGSRGPSGSKGDTGSAGAKGSSGKAGAAGKDGNDGANGSTPTMSSLSGSVLPTRATPRGSGLLWNNRGVVTIG